MSDEDGRDDHMEEGNAIDDDNHADVNEEQDEFENIVLDIKNSSNVWTESGLRKNKTLRELIKCFGCMVKATPKLYSIPDHNGRYRPDDMSYEKLLDASKYVTKAKRELLQNENFDTRDFTIFIANKQWIKNILRPLLELCAKDDSMLAMRCCGLALVLVRRLSDESQKTIKQLSSKTRKASSQDLQANEEEKDLQDRDIDNGKESVLKSGVDASAQSAVAAAVAQRRAINVQQQLSALLSFKEALCSDKCNEAISNAFKEYWLKEQVATSEDHKTIVAICFAYLRRILAIEPISPWSSPGEMLLHRSLHDKYILQLRLLLSVIPGICSDLMNSYHNDWLGDVILIIHFVLKGFEVKELYRVWSSGALIQDFGRPLLDMLDMNTDSTVKLEGDDGGGGGGANHGDGDDTYGSSNTNKENTREVNIALPAVILPDRLVISNRSDTMMAKGQLSKLLQKERTNRQLVGKSALPSNMGSRFKGVFQKNLSIPTATPSIPSLPLTSSGIRSTNQPQLGVTNTHGDTTTTTSTTTSIRGIKQGIQQTTNSSSPSEPPPAVTTKCIPRNAVIIHNPFNEPEANIPQPQAKRNRRNLAFTTEKSIVSKVNEAQYVLGEEHQKAAVVVASLINLLSNELSLKPLVKRVNEDLRRDDLRVGPELELRYFEVLSKVLQYHRMKLMEEQLQSSFKGGSSEKMVWKPNLKNVMDALDRMSFTRVVVAIERIGKSIISIDDVVVPLCLYKEMVCYLRILLESGLEGHHEIAIAALWRLFYASSERLDPLPKLLSGWKAGTYSRAHLVTLVELVHETLKTLEAAHTRFAPLGDGSGDGSDALKKKGKKKKGRHEMDLDQYVMGCMRFKVDDYVRKIASNQTVRMYTKLMSHYKMNDPSTNHHIYCFLQRMCGFVLEQDWKSHDSEWKGTRPISSQLVPDEASLGFMLFNISTLDVFSDFLNDPDVPQTKELEALVMLVKAIVRRFGEALQKNRMLFVELLFQHSRPHEHCCSIDSVYDAAAHAAYLKNGGSMHHHQQQQQQQHNHSSSLHDDNRSPYSSDGSISDDDHDAVAPVDYGDEFDENDLSVRPSSSSSRTSDQKGGGKGKHSSNSASSSKVKKASSSSSSGRGSSSSSSGTSRRRRSSIWTKEEDDVLTEQYACYAGTHSVFTSIAQHPALIALGNNRGEAQISKRVRYLNLHMKMADRDDDDDAEKKKKKQQKHHEEEEEVQRDGVLEDGDHRSTSETMRDRTIVTSSDANRTTTHLHLDHHQQHQQHPTIGSQRSSGSGISGWDNDDGDEDPRKVALFKNSVLSRLNMDDYDNDDADADVLDQRDRGGAKMMMKEVSATKKKKKKKGLIGRRLQSKVGGGSGLDDDEDSDPSFGVDDDDGVDSGAMVMAVVQVPDSVVLQAGFNKKRQLVIDSDEDEE